MLLAINVLECIGNGNPRLTDISKQLRLKRSTAYRLLNTLETSGIICKDPMNKKYTVGNLLLRIASPSILSNERLKICARKEMHYLRDLTEETVIIYTRIGDCVVCLDELPSEQPIKFTAVKTNSVPLYVGSAGRILLSQLNDKDIEKIIRNIDYIPFTANTINDKSAFMESIRESRTKGYATSLSTYVEGTAGISVPIVNYITPLALTILGPADRFGNKVLCYVHEIKESANRISQNLLSGI